MNASFALCSDARLWKTAIADYEKFCLIYALKNGLFDLVKENQPVSLEDLIGKSKLSKRGGEALITVLTALEYLKVSEDRYSLTEISASYCVRSSEYSLVDAMDYYELDEKFAKAVESEESALEWDICKDWDKGQVDVESAAKFSVIMHAASLGPATYLANHIDIEKKYQVKSLLDVGGGSGCYSITFVKYQPNLKTIILDLPAVCQVAQTFIQKASLPESSTVLTFASDMFRQPLPDCNDQKYGYQGILLSQICHDWSKEANMELLRKSFAALPSKGYIFIHEALLHDDGSGPLDIALYSLDMFLMSKGRQYKTKEFRQMLEEAGFVNFEVTKALGMYSLITAMKP